MFFLKIAGTIPRNKQTEFEQTIRYVYSQIPATCENYTLSKDFDQQDAYQFISYWRIMHDMEDFSHSSAYLMIKGAFQTLGRIFEDKSGVIMDLTN